MEFYSVKEDSLLEWPKHLSFVVFVSGCNFSCPWCYVPHLARGEKGKRISEEQVLKEVSNRKCFVDAVCVTGGEPTLFPEAEGFLEKIKKIGLKVKLETNGSNPDFLKMLIERRLVDSVSLDVKNSKEKYKDSVGSDVNIDDISSSLKLISSLEDYEARTTLVPGLHELEDVLKIADWLKECGIKFYCMNDFRSDLPGEKTIDSDFLLKDNYSNEKVVLFKKELEKLGYFQNVRVS